MREQSNMVWVAHRYIFPALESSLPARVLQLHDATAVPNVLSSAREIAAAYSTAAASGRLKTS